MRIEELEFPHTVVGLYGSPPWLGSVIRTAEPLTAHSIRSFGRFDHPNGPTYVYLHSTSAWERDGHIGANVWIYLVQGRTKAKKPKLFASRIRHFSMPTEISVSDDLTLALPLDQIGLERWTERAPS